MLLVRLTDLNASRESMGVPNTDHEGESFHCAVVLGNFFQELHPEENPKETKTIYICPHYSISLDSARYFLDILRSIPHSHLWHLTAAIADIESVFAVVKCFPPTWLAQIHTTILWLRFVSSTWM